ncbi:MAG: phage virion morphogenesis protein, partial [Deltaproteobacteria bacterium]|nr:phage virion morphogenesis protein [Deltaproteobacteria bacterium]
MLNVRLEGLKEINDSSIQFKNNARLSKKILRKIAETLETRLRERTARGIDAKGKPFKPYSAAHAKKRLKEGKTFTVDLQFTGAMLRGLKSSTNEDKGEVVLHFPDPGEAEKASFHNEQGAGKGKVIRRFFELNKDDLDAV